MEFKGVWVVGKGHQYQNQINTPWKVLRNRLSFLKYLVFWAILINAVTSKEIPPNAHNASRLESKNQLDHSIIISHIPRSHVSFALVFVIVVLFVPWWYLNDRTFGIPNLCCQEGRLDESSTNGRCSGNGKHAIEKCQFKEQRCAHWILHCKYPMQQCTLH